MKRIIALVSVLAVAFLFSGCFFQAEPKIGVRFFVDGEAYKTLWMDKTALQTPDDPKKADCDFEGWFLDEGVWENPLTVDSLKDAPFSKIINAYALFSDETSIGPVIPSVPSGFYSLQEAYDLGLLTAGDLYDASFYNNGDYRGSNLIISRAAFAKNPEFLSEETESKIKQAFLDEYYNGYNNGGCIVHEPTTEPVYRIEFTMDDITISKYCGTYNGAVVVRLDGIYGYDGALTSETVGGNTFYYGDSNRLRAWVEGEKEPPQTASSSFYGLQYAYDNGLITRDDLSHISYFFTGEVWEYSIDCDGGDKSTYKVNFEPQMTKPSLADLDADVAADMKAVFYEQNRESMDSSIQGFKNNGYTDYKYKTAIDTISIVSFLGEYNGCYAVRITSSLWGYPAVEYSVNIAYETDSTGGWGITWEMSNSSILIFDNKQPVSFDVGLIENKMTPFNYNHITTILDSPFACEPSNDLINGFEFWLDYDEAFFAQNALVVYLFSAGTAGGSLDVVRLVKQGKKLIMDIYFLAGPEDAESYWTVVLEVDKADIAGIDDIEVRDYKFTDPFPSVPEENLTGKYLLTVEAEIWNNHRPPENEKASDSCVFVATGTEWPDSDLHPFYGYLSMSVRIVTANKDFKVSYYNPGSDWENFVPGSYFRLDDGENYTMFITLLYGGQKKQTIVITGTVGAAY